VLARKLLETEACSLADPASRRTEGTRFLCELSRLTSRKTHLYTRVDRSRFGQYFAVTVSVRRTRKRERDFRRISYSLILTSAGIIARFSSCSIVRSGFKSMFEKSFRFSCLKIIRNNLKIIRTILIRDRIRNESIRDICEIQDVARWAKISRA